MCFHNKGQEEVSHTKGALPKNNVLANRKRPAWTGVIGREKMDTLLSKQYYTSLLPTKLIMKVFKHCVQNLVK